jgi:hypothetical protein
VRHKTHVTDRTRSDASDHGPGSSSLETTTHAKRNNALWSLLFVTSIIFIEIVENGDTIRNNQHEKKYLPHSHSHHFIHFILARKICLEDTGIGVIISSFLDNGGTVRYVHYAKSFYFFNLKLFVVVCTSA